MTIKLRKKEKDYAQVHRNLLFNQNLSFKSKGLGSLLEIYSDDFEVSEKTLINKSTDGKRALKSAIFELEREDFLIRIQTHNTNGQFITIWIFDSELVDIKYVQQIINEMNSINILTTVGTLCTTGTKCGTASTGSGKCTPYNNSTNNNNITTTTTINKIIKQDEALLFFMNYFDKRLKNEDDFLYEYKKFKLLNENGKNRTAENWKRWCLQLKKFELNNRSIK